MMIHLKDITEITGYVRGGCSPLGMKKNYPVILQEDACRYSKIYISGGRIGTTLCLAPESLIQATGAKTENFLENRS